MNSVKCIIVLLFSTICMWGYFCIFAFKDHRPRRMKIVTTMQLAISTIHELAWALMFYYSTHNEPDPEFLLPFVVLFSIIVITAWVVCFSVLVISVVSFCANTKHPWGRVITASLIESTIQFWIFEIVDSIASS